MQSIEIYVQRLQTSTLMRMARCLTLDPLTSDVPGMPRDILGCLAGICKVSTQLSRRGMLGSRRKSETFMVIYSCSGL